MECNFGLLMDFGLYIHLWVKCYLKMEWKFDLVVDLEHQLLCNTLNMGYFQYGAVFFNLYILVGYIHRVYHII